MSTPINRRYSSNRHTRPGLQKLEQIRLEGTQRENANSFMSIIIRCAPYLWRNRFAPASVLSTLF